MGGAHIVIKRASVDAEVAAQPLSCWRGARFITCLEFGLFNAVEGADNLQLPSFVGVKVDWSGHVPGDQTKRIVKTTT